MVDVHAGMHLLEEVTEQHPTDQLRLEVGTNRVFARATTTIRLSSELKSPGGRTCGQRSMCQQQVTGQNHVPE